MHFKNQSQKDSNQIKYGMIKLVNFTIKGFLIINNIEMYSTYNEGKSVITERLIILARWKTKYLGT